MTTISSWSSGDMHKTRRCECSLVGGLATKEATTAAFLLGIPGKTSLTLPMARFLAVLFR